MVSTRSLVSGGRLLYLCSVGSRLVYLWSLVECWCIYVMSGGQLVYLCCLVYVAYWCVCNVQCKVAVSVVYCERLVHF